MERIKEKPPIKSRQKERSGTPLSQGASISAQRAIRQYKESIREAAEEGQSPENYGGQAISDYARSAPVQAVRAGSALAAQYAQKLRKERKAEPTVETFGHESTESVSPRPESPHIGQDVPARHEFRQVSELITRYSEIQPVPQRSYQAGIKEKNEYIQVQPTQDQQHPSSDSVNHHAMEQGRKLAENRAQTQKELRREASIATAKESIEPGRPIRPYNAKQGRTIASQASYSEREIKKHNIREKRSSVSVHARTRPPADRGSDVIRPPRSLVKDAIPKHNTSPASASPPFKSDYSTRSVPPIQGMIPPVHAMIPLA